MTDHSHTHPATDHLTAPGTGNELTFFSWYAVLGHAVLAGSIAGVLTTIWAVSGFDVTYWPRWPETVLAMFLVAHAGTTASVRGRHFARDGRIRLRRVRGVQVGFECHLACIAALGVLLFGLWACAGADDGTPPWPVWPMGALGFILAGHAAIVLALRAGTVDQRRVEQLTRTRAGVVEAQELELRRIERDLHDGAQARLVALGMQLGLAEQQMDRSPEAARALLAEARASTQLALRELRALARGIYPPVLADRGLVPAIRSLAAASPMTVEVEGGGDPRERLPAAVEGALYFTAAEALANAGKHARATRVTVQVRRGEFDVVLTVVDDGVGGADASGSGLVGIRQRVEALDGRLAVTSPSGGPTTIRAELPCER